MTPLLTEAQIEEIRELASLPDNGSIYFEHVRALLAHIDSLAPQSLKESEGADLLSAFAPRQREHIEVLTSRADWRVASVTLSRDGNEPEVLFAPDFAHLRPRVSGVEQSLEAGKRDADLILRAADLADVNECQSLSASLRSLAARLSPAKEGGEDEVASARKSGLSNERP